MNKKQFLKGLEEALLEQMDISEAAPHIRYYQDYIENELSNGKSEDEVMASLQTPRLIAKNIVNNSDSANKYKSDIYGGSYNSNRSRENSNSTTYYEDNDENNNKYINRGPVSFSVNGKPINSIWFKIAIIAIFIVIVVLVFAVIAGVMWLLTRLLLPVAIIGGVIYLLANIIKRT